MIVGVMVAGDASGWRGPPNTICRGFPPSVAGAAMGNASRSGASGESRRRQSYWSCRVPPKQRASEVLRIQRGQHGSAV